MLCKTLYGDLSFGSQEGRSEIISFLKKEGLHTRQEIINFYNALNWGDKDTFNSVIYKEIKIYEFITQELVSHLADYLAERINTKFDQPICVLEVGAGSGLLTHHLKIHFKSKYPQLQVQIIATDSYSWKIRQASNDTEVYQMDHREALEKFKPNIVINSWMPREVDFSKEFRSTPSVLEYVLIGDPEVCGDSRETWGVRHHREGFRRI